jgi:hypothetical protein
MQGNKNYVANKHTFRKGVNKNNLFLKSRSLSLREYVVFFWRIKIQ